MAAFTACLMVLPLRSGMVFPVLSLLTALFLSADAVWIPGLDSCFSSVHAFFATPTLFPRVPRFLRGSKAVFPSTEIYAIRGLFSGQNPRDTT